jgi:hypothetical protein
MFATLSFLDVIILPECGSSVVNCGPSLKCLNHSKVIERLKESSPKAVLIIVYVSVAFLPSFKQNMMHICYSFISEHDEIGD